MPAIKAQIQIEINRLKPITTPTDVTEKNIPAKDKIICIVPISYFPLIIVPSPGRNKFTSKPAIAVRLLASLTVFLGILEF